jgi:DNA-binding MurR/RpiR family transcriptional regulator
LLVSYEGHFEPRNETFVSRWIEGETNSSEAVKITELYTLLRERYNDLPPKQRQVADVILSKPTASSYSTVADLAAAARVTKATVVRLCQSIGFHGYAELRSTLRGNKSFTHLWPSDLLQQSESAVGSNPAFASLRQDSSNLQDLLTTEFQESLTRVVAAMAKARRVLVISAGSHAGTGLMLTHNLNFIGRPAVLENRSGTYLGQALSVLTPEDLVVSLVLWHVPPEIPKALEWSREKSIPTIAITDSPVSPTALIADLHLLIPTESASFFRSQTAAMAAVNALLTELASVDRERTITAIARAQETWDKLMIYDR